MNKELSKRNQVSPNEEMKKLHHAKMRILEYASSENSQENN